MRSGLTDFVERVRHSEAVMRSRAAALTALLLFAAAPATASENERTERGEAILSEACASCHAIGKTGESPDLEALPFRFLSKDYPVEDLAESLAEGIMSGHPDMPVFAFEPHDVDAIIAYLQSIQVSPDTSPAKPEMPPPGDADG
jgi:mono/diheme cytochrome c family protein